MTRPDYPLEPTFERWQHGNTYLYCQRCGLKLGVVGRAIPHTLRECFDRLASDVQDLQWQAEKVSEAYK